MNDKRRIGIMGGTFDPIHIGHLILGETAYEQFHLDQVLFLPAGNPPHKTNRSGRATDEQRVEMVRRAIAGNPHFDLSLAEMHADGYTYTYRTLEKMQGEMPDAEFYFIIGADSLYDFEQWKEPARICKSARIVVATRDHLENNLLDQQMLYLTEQMHGIFLKLESLNIDISSHMLRDWIKKERTIRYYVPDDVASYIYENKIYR